MAHYRLEAIRTFFNILEPSERRKFRYLLGFTLLSAGIQSIGVAAIFPFMNMVLDPEVLTRNPWLFFLQDLLKTDDSMTLTMFFGGVLLVLIIAGNLASTYTQWLGSRFVWQLNHRLSSSLLKRYLSCPYTYYLDKNSAELGKNVLAEVGEMTHSFLIPLLTVVTKLLLAGGILVLLLVVDPVVTLIAFTLIGGAYLSIFRGFRKQLSRAGEKRYLLNTQRYQTVNEVMGGIKELKILGRESFFLERFNQSSRKMVDLHAWSEMIGKLPRHLMEVVSFGGVVVLTLVLLATRGNVQQIIPLISLYAFAGYRLMPSLQDAFNAVTTLQFSLASVEKIERDLQMGEGPTGEREDGCDSHEGPVSAQPDSGKPVLQLRRDMRLEEVSFWYPGKPEAVLHKVNLVIPRHSSMALAGPSGAGKTTLADILLGLLVPQEGRFLVDGQPVTTANSPLWQQNLGYVPQQIYLSDDTVRHNIAFGIPESMIDHDAVRRAAQIANIDAFITEELPLGYDTLVGERGIRLSGGQRQRIGLARALYHDPEVLVLDEATSALDGITETAVIRAIENISRLKTMIVIAHRMETIRECDQIVLLEEGRIVDQGTYQELLVGNERFRAMAREENTGKDVTQ